jgi:xanthine dehydrogenase YagS FAD-binding subunit
MTPFRYEKASDAAGAVEMSRHATAARYLAGGTNLVDLMRETIERPQTLIDVSELSGGIQDTDGGGLRIGAGVKNTTVATHRSVRERFPLLARAILSGASGQIRNMASVGGNIMQRTRCYYFYDNAARCNKREPGAGCDAMDGFNRIHAILGASGSCIAAHPSDMCVALAALDATVQVEGPQGARPIKLTQLHRLPGDTPEIETVLQPGELITAVELAANRFAGRCSYRKVRDRSSFAFALVSVAAALELANDGRIVEARLALGGVAHKPWRAHSAEAVLAGATPSEARFQEAADAELASARGLAHNTFKIDLAKRVIVSSFVALAQSTGASG